ncbi:GLG1 [Cordylochernes scorpioides]|uniref:GLG1 n=1 Tax=Cordylochernes scorpioides TaxID=51811 RepID=A0ABY6KCA7_9ARAC|nr:GLG1 [Cordylochernes scorpioides]
MEAKKEGADLSQECNHLIWSYKLNLTNDARFEKVAKNVCADFIKEHQKNCKVQESQRGQLLSCLLDHMETSSQSCQAFLRRMAVLVFSDYHLVYRFTDACGDDIKALHCGSLERGGSEAPHSQGSTIECLSKNPEKLQVKCHHEIIRIAELQADDFHLDRPLFFACRDDRERLCPQVVSGDSRVYRCLLRHRSHRDMSQECKEQLYRRERLAVHDYKVSRRLARACREPIRQNHCREDTSDHRDIRLAQILLCLENLIHKGVELPGECQAEMLEHRRILMENYQLTPELASDCATEVTTLCSGSKLEATLHCLMDHARRGSEISSSCRRQANAMKLAINDNILKEKAILLALKMGQDNFEASNGWLERFKARRNIAFKRLHGEAGSVEANSVATWKGGIIPSLLAKYSPQDIFNADETGLFYKLLPNQTMTIRGFVMDEAMEEVVEEEMNRCFEALKKHQAIDVNYIDFLEVDKDVQVAGEQSIEEIVKEVMGKEEDEELEKVVQVADAGEDWRADPALQEACRPVVASLCAQVPPGEGRVLACLMDRLEAPAMAPECRDKLLLLQYFLARDFKLDPQLYRRCHKEAVTHCHAKEEWWDKPGNTDPDRSPIVLPCLYHLAYHPSDNVKLSRECLYEVRRVMRQRAASVDLHPEIEEPCVLDLSQLCSANIGRGQELQCLQSHLENLRPQCAQSVSNYTAEEAEHLELNYPVYQACSELLPHFCPMASMGVFNKGLGMKDVYRGWSHHVCQIWMLAR